jgi:DNA-binding response OmpR family regulator
MGDAWIYSTGAATDTLVRLLAELGFSPRRMRADGDGAGARPPMLAVVVAGREDPAPNALCAELRTRTELADVPLLLALEPEHLRWASDLVGADELLVPPYSVAELRVRVARARRALTADYADDDTSDDIVRAGSLALNLITYEVTIEGRAVGFTYIEYELLKFLMTHPRRAFSREALLTRVWGYAYYGSGRTVDVHVRRLRAKLGPEHAARIKTVRSVGYLFDAAQHPPRRVTEIARVAV